MSKKETKRRLAECPRGTRIRLALTDEGIMTLSEELKHELGAFRIKKAAYGKAMGSLNKIKELTYRAKEAMKKGEFQTAARHLNDACEVWKETWMRPTESGRPSVALSAARSAILESAMLLLSHGLALGVLQKSVESFDESEEFKAWDLITGEIFKEARKEIPAILPFSVIGVVDVLALVMGTFLSSSRVAGGIGSAVAEKSLQAKALKKVIGEVSSWLNELREWSFLAGLPSRTLDADMPYRDGFEFRMQKAEGQIANMEQLARQLDQ